MSLSMTRPYKKPAISVPPYPFYKVGLLIDSDWDTAAKLIALADGQMTTNVNGDTIRMTAGAGEYMYLFSPVANGEITFQALGGAGVGGWDGIEWLTDGSVGVSTGPKTVTLNFGVGDEQWYAYRTDFNSLGMVNWRLSYARDQF